MDFRVFVEPQQGASYSDQLAVAQTAESLGFSAFFRSDHYSAMSGDGLPGPTDSWVTLTTFTLVGTAITGTETMPPTALTTSVQSNEFFSKLQSSRLSSPEGKWGRASRAPPSGRAR